MLPRNDPDRIQIIFDDHHHLETGPESPDLEVELRE